MSRNTRTAQKSGLSVPRQTESLATAPYSKDDDQEKEVTLQDIFSKLGSLDRIETKLDNLNDRVELLENRVSKIEDDSHQISDVNKELSGLRSNNMDLLKRMEILENKDRQGNIKILNIPLTPMETKTQLHGKVI
jgi:septal ring factor EnvC (AmiA/AmiB activator)